MNNTKSMKPRLLQPKTSQALGIFVTKGYETMVELTSFMGEYTLVYSVDHNPYNHSVKRDWKRNESHRVVEGLTSRNQIEGALLQILEIHNTCSRDWSLDAFLTQGINVDTSDELKPVGLVTKLIDRWITKSFLID